MIRRILLFSLIVSSIFLAGCTPLVSVFCPCAPLLFSEDVPEDFDENTESILRAITEDPISGEMEFDVIGTEGRIKSTAPFESDEITVLYATLGCFDSDISRDDVNTLNYVEVKDENGRVVRHSILIERIFQAIADTVDTPFLNVYIIVCNDMYFPVVELNVNWWAPRRLFYYNTKSGNLTELYTYNHKKIVGLEVLTPSNLPE